MPYTTEQVGYQNTDTSHGAALNVDASTIRGKCLVEVKREPGTADEIADRLGLPFISVRPRLTELAMAGKVEDSGERHEGQFGRPQIVWREVK